MNTTVETAGTSFCPHTPSLPPQQTRPTWLRTSLCCKIPPLIIQDPLLDSAPRLLLWCIAQTIETVLGSFLSFHLVCLFLALHPHGCLPCPSLIFISPPCPFGSCHFAAASSSSASFLPLPFYFSHFIISCAHSFLTMKILQLFTRLRRT